MHYLQRFCYFAVSCAIFLSASISSMKLVSQLCFVSFVLGRSTLDLSWGLKLTTSLESTVPEKMSTISMSQKLDMSVQ